MVSKVTIIDSYLTFLNTERQFVAVIVKKDIIAFVIFFKVNVYVCDESGRMCTYIYVVVLVNAISTKTSRKRFPRQPGSCGCNGRPTGRFWHPSGHRRTVLGPAEEESFPVPHQVSLVHHPWYERHHRAGVQFQTVTSLTCCFCFFFLFSSKIT